MRLLDLVRAEDVRGVLDELTTLTPEDRARARTAVAEHRAAMDRELWRWGPDDRWHDERVAVLAAGLGCQDSPAAVVAWLSRPENQWRAREEFWHRPWLAGVADQWPAARRTEISALLSASLPAFPATHVGTLLELGLIGPVDAAVHCLGELHASDAVYQWGIWIDVVRKVTTDPAARSATAGQRGDLFDRAVAQILGGANRDQRRYALDFMNALALTPDEHRARVNDHLALLDSDSAVAAFAQKTLHAVDAGEPEASERLLRRPEKKLVRAQLSALDKRARRDPPRAGQVVLAAAIAFEHPDPAVQEQALTVAGRHLAAAGESVVPELRAATAWLTPALAGRAAELLGEQADAPEPEADALPEVAAPEPVPGPLATVAAVVEEVAAAVTGDAPPERNLVARRRFGGFSVPGELLAARIDEAAGAVRSGAVPFLLATPTLATGALDAAVLAARVAAYEGLGVQPGPYDLTQALLRVTPDPGVHVPQTSEAGRRLHAWLHAGGLPHADSTPADWPPPRDVLAHWRERGRADARPWSPAVFAIEAPCPLPEHAAALLGAYRRAFARTTSAHPYWLAQLPHHGDEFAARAYRGRPQRGKGAARTLPLLAEAAGPAGYAVHLVLAESIGISVTDSHRDHVATVDALLITAARGHLDTTLLGEQLAVLVTAEAVLATRAAVTLRAVADGGAYGVVLSILRSMLPGLLGEEPVRGAAGLLALATECAVRTHATGAIPEVTAVAERKGSSLLVRYARTLRDTLGDG